MIRRIAALVVATVLMAACGNGDGDGRDTLGTPATTDGGAETTTTAREGAAMSTTAAPVELEVTEVATGLDTPWALAWDAEGQLWVTERPGLLRRIGGPTIRIDGAVEQGEGGLMGLEFDDEDRIFLMYTSQSDNRVTRRRADGTGEEVLVSGIRKAGNHNGGRIRFGPDGTLYASTGDAAQPALAQDNASLNGKVLAIDPRTGDFDIFSKGHRNAQGLCSTEDGRFLSTEHGPANGDEVNELRRGFNGGWPDTVGNGIINWSPAIAPAGCAIYEAALIPQWQGSMLFVTLADRDLRRLTFAPDGSVAFEEILYDEEFGRLRDVRVGPDGAVYLTTSNRDGRGDPRPGDDRILRIAPKGR